MHLIRIGESYVNLDSLVSIDPDPENPGGALVETVCGRVRHVAPADAVRLWRLADRLVRDSQPNGLETTHQRTATDEPE